MADEYIKGSDELQLTLLEWLKQGPQSIEVLQERLPYHTRMEIIEALRMLRMSGAEMDFNGKTHVYRLVKP